MNEPEDPNPAPQPGGPLDEAMRAGFRGDAEAPSVLTRLGAGGVPRSAVLLRDEDSDGAPIVQTRTPDLLQRHEGRYQMLGEIARGGVGIVLKGRDVDLGRDVAMKVLHEKYAGKPDVLTRFVEEAQIGGQLQHPGIVPVYELGVRADDRPYFTMKLIKGRTLAFLLQERPDPGHERRRFLSIFEAVCQTMAYAHARGVIHRDLKPSNVMVGAFGEVQVVDWGLAKVLPRGGVADERPSGPAQPPDLSVIATVRSGSTGSESMAGSVMGTPSYMPPEQARGDVASGNERSDVFSLGAILCEVLTGKAPYVGSAEEVYQGALRGQLDEAHARLAACGADRELIDIAVDCMTPARQGRPKDAGVVAKRIGAYLASIEERAREAQLAAAEARVRAAEERRARRLTLALAASVLAVVVVGGGGFAWVQHDRAGRVAEADRGVEAALAEASLLRGRAAVAGDLLSWNAALSAAQKADAVARSAEADGPARDRASSFLARVRPEAEAAKASAAREERNGAMLARLEGIRERSADEDRSDPAASNAAYGAAFRDFGIDPDALSPEEAKARLIGTGVAVPLAFSLDDWALVRRQAGKGASGGDARLSRLAAEVDPDPWRRRLREAGNDRTALRALAASAETADASFEGLVRLGEALGAAGDGGGAVALLLAAWPRHPEDFWCNYTLARLIRRREGSGEDEPFLRAALALRPRSAEVRIVWAASRVAAGDPGGARGLLEAAAAASPGDGHILAHLAFVLRDLGRAGEAQAAARKAVLLSKEDCFAHAALGVCLVESGDIPGAVAELRESVRLDPGYAGGFANLSGALQAAGDLDGALAAAGEAVRIGRDDGSAHFALAGALWRQGRPQEALAPAWEAVRLDPREEPITSLLRAILQGMPDRPAAVASARAFVAAHPGNPAGHGMLGELLDPASDGPEAIAAFRESLRLDPGSPSSVNFHFNLAALLEANRDVDGAIAEFRAALALQPGYAEAHCNLGTDLQRKGLFAEALEEFRKGHALGSRREGWPYPSDQWVRTAERYVALAPRLPALLRGETRPADARDAAGFAGMCYLTGRYAAAARFHSIAFAPDGSPAEGVDAGLRYDAACALALAASGEGEDAASSDEAARTLWRSRALACLRAELEDHRRRMKDPSTYAPGGSGLPHWREDPDLRGVRDPGALARLQAAERAAWAELWSGVDSLIGSAPAGR